MSCFFLKKRFMESRRSLWFLKSVVLRRLPPIRVLDVALLEGNEVVILGAFGCGAFENNTEVVARAAKTVVDEYRKTFKTIEFAIYCKPNEDRNYKIFERVMKER